MAPQTELTQAELQILDEARAILHAGGRTAEQIEAELSAEHPTDHSPAAGNMIAAPQEAEAVAFGWIIDEVAYNRYGLATLHQCRDDSIGATTPLYTSPPAQAVTEWPRGTRIRVEHDGFKGVVLGPYTTLEGKRGQVCQLDGARVVHVCGEKWLVRLDETCAPEAR